MGLQDLQGTNKRFDAFRQEYHLPKECWTSNKNTWKTHDILLDNHGKKRSSKLYILPLVNLPRYSCASQDCCDTALHGLEIPGVDRSNPPGRPGKMLKLLKLHSEYNCTTDTVCVRAQKYTQLKRERERVIIDIHYKYIYTYIYIYVISHLSNTSIILIP